MTAEAFYLPVADGTFQSTAATTSPWDAGSQHGGPPSALLARAIETHQPRPHLAISRISIDFLGTIPQGILTISTTVLRPGRRVELVEARLDTGGRTVAVARAWLGLIEPGSTPVIPAPQPPPALPGPQPQRYFPGVDPEWGYGRAVEWRFVRGHYDELGPAVVWARPLLPLIPGEPMSGVQRALIIADSANGISGELPLADWLFIPSSVTMTVYREPVGEWVLLDAETAISSRGTGMAHATVSDKLGRLGVVTQPLLVQRR